MNIVWVHEELAARLKASTRISPAPSLRKKAALIITITACSALFITAPLILMRARQSNFPRIVTPTLPELRGFAPRSKLQLLASLSTKKQKTQRATIGYLAEVIRSTGVQGQHALHLSTQIVVESLSANYDPFFVASVILFESTFRQQARSPKGAVGLMQILPATGRYISQVSRRRWEGPAALREPQYNIQLGIAYLQHLERMFGDRTHVLLAYNWGPGNLQEHFRTNRKHPPRSSYEYSSRIQHTCKRWKQQFAQRMVGALDLTSRG